MQKNRQIIIYGGSFDPPHIGHFELIKAALEQKKPDKLFVVPSFRSPFKTGQPVSYKARTSMLRAGFKAYGLATEARLLISPFEEKRARVTYTWQTIAYFKKKFPDAELFFLMGSDCLDGFKHWKNHTRILAAAQLLIGKREGFISSRKPAIPCQFLRGVFPEAASSSLKPYLYSGLPHPALLGSVYSCAALHNLYFSILRRKVALMMGAKRFAHTCAATKLAVELALKHKIDVNKTAIAAILHDSARDFSPEKLFKLVKRYKIKIPLSPELAAKSPVLLHSFVGAALAARIFAVRDREVVRAIRNHTLGANKPGMLEKIIFTADLAAEDRVFPAAAKIRALALKDLNRAHSAAVAYKKRRSV